MTFGCRCIRILTSETVHGHVLFCTSANFRARGHLAAAHRICVEAGDYNVEDRGYLTL